MSSLIIRNLDDATLRALEDRAQAHGRTLEEEAQALLADTAQASFSHAELLEWTRRIRAMTPKDAVQPDSTDMIREDRDSR
jgi:hypothetical protein